MRRTLRVLMAVSLLVALVLGSAGAVSANHNPVDCTTTLDGDASIQNHNPIDCTSVISIDCGGDDDGGGC